MMRAGLFFLKFRFYKSILVGNVLPSRHKRFIAYDKVGKKKKKKAQKWRRYGYKEMSF